MSEELTFGMAVFFYGSIIFFIINIFFLNKINTSLTSLNKNIPQFMGIMTLQMLKAPQKNGGVGCDPEETKEPYKIHEPATRAEPIITPVEDEEKCRFCGAKKKKQGIKQHEKFCKENPEKGGRIDEL